MSTRRNSPRRWLWQRGILVGVLLAGVALTPSYAVENVRREIKHFFECAGYIFRDPQAHIDYCQPNRVPPFFGSLSPTTGGPSTVVAVPPSPAPTPPAPPPPPPPPPAPDPCACGACPI